MIKLINNKSGSVGVIKHASAAIKVKSQKSFREFSKIKIETIDRSGARRFTSNSSGRIHFAEGFREASHNTVRSVISSFILSEYHFTTQNVRVVRAYAIYHVVWLHWPLNAYFGAHVLLLTVTTYQFYYQLNSNFRKISIWVKKKQLYF